PGSLDTEHRRTGNRIGMMRYSGHELAQLSIPVLLCPLEYLIYTFPLIKVSGNLHIISRLAMKECEKSEGCG
ncbi:MAG TPA: hypothetical protein VIO58_01590, partial [Candidatus Methanoperedens sp.]